MTTRAGMPTAGLRRWSMRILLSLALVSGLGVGAGCTLCKPIACAVTGPIVVLSEGVHFWRGGCGGQDGYGAVFALGAICGVCAVGGLITGVISDYNVVSGACVQDVTDDWYHPFRTNLR